MSESVYVIGAGRTDFRRNLRKEGTSLADIVREVGLSALDDAAIEPGDVQSGVIGNFAAGMFTQQLHLGAMLVGIDESMRGIPTFHTEAACASGSVAILAGAQQITSGSREVVLVVGAEQQKTMSPSEGGEVLGAAGDYANEREKFGKLMFPALFGEIAKSYSHAYGLTEAELARVALKNYAHARLNPEAQTRGNSLTLEQAVTGSETNPRIAGSLKVTDCSQITDGAAAVVLCSKRFFDRLGSGRPGIHLAGFGHTTDHLSLEKKDVPNFPIARRAAEQAYSMANAKVTDLDGIDVHDCFSITEIVTYELLGLAAQGMGGRLAASGATALPAVQSELGVNPSGDIQIPVNPGGGLIGDGHPVGATGVRQCGEAYRQLTDSAGARQIEGAKRYLTFNLGGSFTTSVAMIWETA